MAKKKDKKKENDTEFSRFNFVYGEALELTEEEQERLVTKYYKLVSDSLKARNDRENEWSLNSMILSNQRPPKTKPWPNCSNVALGTAAEMRDTIAETIVAREHSSERVYNLSGQDDFSIEHEEEVERWLNAVVDNDEEFKFTDEFVRALATDDTAVALIDIDREVITKKKWVSIESILADANKGVMEKITDIAKNIFGGYKIREYQEVTVKHYPRVIKAEDVIVPSNGTSNINRNSFMGYFFYPTLDDLKARNAKREFYKNLDKLEGKETIPTEDNEQKKDEQDDKKQVKNEVAALKPVVIFAKEDMNKDGEYKEIVLIFNYPTKIFLRCQYSQFFYGKRPMINCSALPDRDNFWGTAIASLIRPLQLEAEAIINQTMDNWDLVIKKMFVRIKGAKITLGNKDGDDNEIFPGTIFDVAGKDDLSVLNVGSVDYNSQPLMNRYEGYMMKRAGFTSTAGGDSTDPRASGKKIGMLLSQGSIRIDAIFKRYNSVKAGVYAKMLIALYAQYGDKTLKYRAWDEKTKSFKIASIDREVLQDCIFKINLNGLQFSTSRESEKQEELWFYETILKNPLFVGTPTQLANYSESQLESIMEITKQLFRKYGKDNKDRLLPSLDTLKQSIKQEVTAQVEAEMKKAFQASLANPKARPDEIEKVQAMADQTDISEVMGGGQPNA